MDNFRDEAPYEQQGLYDPRFEHDNCGIGAVVNINGKQSRYVVENALNIILVLGSGKIQTNLIRGDLAEIDKKLDDIEDELISQQQTDETDRPTPHEEEKHKKNSRLNFIK